MLPVPLKAVGCGGAADEADAEADAGAGMEGAPDEGPAAEAGGLVEEVEEGFPSSLFTKGTCLKPKKSLPGGRFNGAGAPADESRELFETMRCLLSGNVIL